MKSLYKKIRPYIPFAAFVAIIVLLVVFIISLFTPKYKAPFKYMEQMANGNFSNFQKLAPDFVMEKAAKKAEKTVDEMVEGLEKNYDEAMANSEEELGKDIKFIVKNVKKDRNLSDDELKTIRAALKKSYGIKEKTVKKGCYVNYTTVVKSDSIDEKNNSTVISVKIGRKWYLCQQDGIFMTKGLF